MPPGHPLYLCIQKRQMKESNLPLFLVLGNELNVPCRQVTFGGNIHMYNVFDLRNNRVP